MVWPRSHQIRYVRTPRFKAKRLATDKHAFRKAYSEYFDPCQEAADKSIKCLKRNGGERAMCVDFFQ
jgi:hypothetical protein